MNFPRETRSLEKTVLYSAVHANKMIQRRIRGRHTPYELHGRCRRPTFHHTALRTLNGYEEDLRLEDSCSPLTWKAQKTEEQFPIPVLYRSKSLEDLRETTVVSKLKEQNLDNNASKKVQQEELATCLREFDCRFSLRSNSFSHHSNNNNSPRGEHHLGKLGDNSLGNPPGSPSGGSCAIKKEIESMSMRIEKLDVA